VLDPKSLAVIPPKQLAVVPPHRHYEQAYFAQARQPTLPSPPTKLLLKGLKVTVPQGTKLLPPVDNEKLIKVTTNKFGMSLVQSTLPLASSLMESMHLLTKSSMLLQEKLARDLLHPRLREKQSVLG
jgi:hypothetical protein